MIIVNFLLTSTPTPSPTPTIWQVILTVIQSQLFLTILGFILGILAQRYILGNQKQLAKLTHSQTISIADRDRLYAANKALRRLAFAYSQALNSLSAFSYKPNRDFSEIGSVMKDKRKVIEDELVAVHELVGAYVLLDKDGHILGAMGRMEISYMLFIIFLKQYHKGSGLPRTKEMIDEERVTVERFYRECGGFREELLKLADFWNKELS